MTVRRGAGLAVGAVALLGIAGLWAIPNLAGRAFVDVRLVAAPVAGDVGARQRHIVLGTGVPTVAGAIRLAIRIEGRYPLPVAVGWTNPPLRVELRTTSASGTGEAVWSVTGSAAELEAGIDSPDATGNASVVLVRPGPLDLAIGPPGGVGLHDADGGDLPPGRYALRAWALGIPSGILQLEVRE